MSVLNYRAKSISNPDIKVIEYTNFSESLYISSISEILRTDTRVRFEITYNIGAVYNNTIIFGPKSLRIGKY